MKTSYQLKHLITPTMDWSIAALRAAIVAGWLAAPGNAFPANPAVAAAPSFTAQHSASSVLDFRGLNDYQPPDNGGPVRTGGSGTR